MAFTFYKQLNEMDCGPTCLRMITRYYGKHYNADTLRRYAGFAKGGVNLLGISETAEKVEFVTQGVQLSFEKLLFAPLPAILHWNQNHFVVIAHRLSTVKNADNIVVLYNGTIAEQGTHLHLISLKWHYYKLAKNQLELGG